MRLYDTSVSRRPVFTVSLSQTPILQLRLHPDTLANPSAPLTSGKEAPEVALTLQELQFVYTDKNGHFGLYSTATRRELGIYKGATGAVLGVTAAEGLVAGVGFDRYLWVYEGEREMVGKVYVKTKGTAVVVLDAEDEVVERKKEGEGEGEENEVWEEMEEVMEEGEEEGGKGDYTGALVKIKRKKGGSKASGEKKRRVE